MTRIIVRRLVWNEYNRAHVRKHNVVEYEVEIAGEHIIYHQKSYAGRYLVIGRSKKRLLALVLKRRSTKSYLVITARDASKKERKKVYEIEKKQNTGI